jgi:hypothetical protein
MYNVFELNCNGDVTAVRPSDGKARIKSVTSRCTIPYSILLRDNKDKMIYSDTNKLDRQLSNGHQMLGHLGKLRAKIGPGTLRPCAPIDTPMYNC